MRFIFWILLSTILCSCESFPPRQRGEIQPTDKREVSITQKQVLDITEKLGFNEIKCDTFKYSKGDIGAPALTYGANVDSTSRCMKKPKDLAKDFSIEAFLVLNKTPKNSMSVELWSNPPGKEQEMLDVVAKFWNAVGKLQNTNSSIE